MRPWLRNLLIAVGILVVVGGTGYANRGYIMWTYVMPKLMQPDGDFDDTALAALDVSDEVNWAALPWRQGELADQMPIGANHTETGVAVFYIHPTSSMMAETWNQPMEAEREDELIHTFFLPGQASAFSQCCDVYAPYYRQAAFFSFMQASGSNGEAAINAAYQDVRAAFTQFLLWVGDAPFIIAGHSQGSAHGLRLLVEEVYGSPFEGRLVAAYLPGFRITEAAPIRACTDERATGCVLAWNIFTPGASMPPGYYNSPVWHGNSYTRDDLGLLICNPPAADIVGIYTSFIPSVGELAPSVGEAECDGGLWRTPLPANEALHMYEVSPGWLHVTEFSYTWVAIGNDAVRRAEAWNAPEF